MSITLSKQQEAASDMEQKICVSFPNETDSSLEDCRSIPSLSDLSEEDIEVQWFGPHDFEIFKLTAKQIAKQARQSSLNELLMTSFTNRSSQDEDPLFRWAKHGQMRRGLEQWISPRHRDERHTKKKMAIKAVLHAQHLLREMNADIDCSADHLARLSRKYTSDASLFAERMGRADAEAAATEPPQKPPLRDFGNLVGRRRRVLEDMKNSSEPTFLLPGPRPDTLKRSTCGNSAAWIQLNSHNSTKQCIFCTERQKSCEVSTL